MHEKLKRAFEAVEQARAAAAEAAEKARAAAASPKRSQPVGKPGPTCARGLGRRRWRPGRWAFALALAMVALLVGAVSWGVQQCQSQLDAWTARCAAVERSTSTGNLADAEAELKALETELAEQPWWGSLPGFAAQRERLARRPRSSAWTSTKPGVATWPHWTRPCEPSGSAWRKDSSRMHWMSFARPAAKTVPTRCWNQLSPSLSVARSKRGSGTAPIRRFSMRMVRDSIVWKGARADPSTER